MNRAVCSLTLITCAASASGYAACIEDDAQVDVTDPWTVIHTHESKACCYVVTLSSLERTLLSELSQSIRLGFDADSNLVFMARKSGAAEIHQRIAQLMAEPDDPWWLSVYMLDSLDTRTVVSDLQQRFPEMIIVADSVGKKVVVRARRSDHAKVKARIDKLELDAKSR